MQLVLVLFLIALVGWAQNQPTVPDSLVKQATEVKERHEKALMKLPAAVGVGVSASKRSPGKAAILIYTSREWTAKERKRIPIELEGVPVESYMSGSVTAPPRPAPARRKN